MQSRCGPYPARAGRPGHPRECHSGHRRGPRRSSSSRPNWASPHPNRNDPAGREQPGRFLICGCVGNNAERQSFHSRLWITVANATLARCQHRPAAAAGVGGGVGVIVAAPGIHPHVLQLLVGHQRHGGALVDQRGRHARFPIGRVGGVGEVELAEVYVVGHFYPQNLVALCAFVEWSSVSARFYAFSGWPALNPVMAAGGALVSMVAESCAFVAWPQCGCALSASRHDAQRTCLVV